MPRPLSPIARIVALPGRIVNTVLQPLDLTVSSSGTKSPLNFAPIDEALFRAFRRVEDAVGLDNAPAEQQVQPYETYTGPTTTPTPTVAQFLDAAAAEYVLGGTPGGLQSFTVNGVPMTSTNVLSGEAAQVWVTPQEQILIAYQGTAGGTNLLSDPLIAVTQIIANAQVIFTDTTPQAFTDSLTFEHQVQTAAASRATAPAISSSPGTHWAGGRPNTSPSKPAWAASDLRVPESTPPCRVMVLTRDSSVSRPMATPRHIWRPICPHCSRSCRPTCPAGEASRTTAQS